MTERICGTGGWAGPLPGDPDNNVILSASIVFGGIQVSWTYPTVNPYAVAHVLLYRGITNDFNLATLHRVVQGSSYYDQIAPADTATYYYWIKIVSINGTTGELIGPAQAVAQLHTAQVLELLNGQLTESALNTTLQTKIDNIALNEQSIYDEIQARLTDSSSIAAAFSVLESDMSATNALILGEITQRQTALLAEASTRNILAAQLRGTYEGTDLASLSSGLLYEERQVRATTDGALATSISTLGTTVDGHSTSISTQATSINGLEGQYTVKIDNNGYVTGYGLASTPVNGTPFSEFAVVADKFSIAPVATDAGAADGSPFFHLTSPTTIGGVSVPAGTYMKSAFIHDASITNAKIAAATIGEAKIANAAITEAKIANAAITTAKISDLSVSTLKIQGEAIVVARGGITASDILLTGMGNRITIFTLPSMYLEIGSSVQVTCTFEFLNPLPSTNFYPSLHLISGVALSVADSRFGNVPANSIVTHTKTLIFTATESKTWSFKIACAGSDTSKVLAESTVVLNGIRR
jgi:hypothetical protein